MAPILVVVITYWIAFVTFPRAIYPDWIKFEADAASCCIYPDKVALKETQSGFTYLLKLQCEYCRKHNSYLCSKLENLWVFCSGAKFRGVLRQATAIKADWDEIKSKATTSRR